MDELDDLPIDNEKSPTSTEIKTLGKYFKSGGKKAKDFWGELKDVLIATILFLLLSTKYLDMALDYLPQTDNVYIRTGLKGLIFMVLYYVIIIMTN